MKRTDHLATWRQQHKPNCPSCRSRTTPGVDCARVWAPKWNASKSKRDAKLIALSDSGGGVMVHAELRNFGYATLCGLSDDDDTQKPAALPMGAKIDCSACGALFMRCINLRASDFALHVMPRMR